MLMPKPDLPESLTNCIRGASVEVLSWSADSGELLFRIKKDAVAETGTMIFTGVSHVNIPPRFDIVGIGAYNQPFPDYPCIELDDSEVAFGLQDTKSFVYLVIAKTINYSIERDN